MCVCNPVEKNGHYFVSWIGDYFGTCVWYPLDIVAFSFGLANIGFWLFVQFPQLYENFRYKRVEALSPFFLVQWLLGDIANLIGYIFTHQRPILLYTSVYFCVIDLLMLIQFVYYRLRYGEKAGEDRPLLWDEKPIKSKKRLYLLYIFSLVSISYTMSICNSNDGINYSGRLLLETESPCIKSNELLPWENVAGIVCAWVAGIIYSCSRLPQIYRNYKRKSVEGLAFGMFFCTICGCILYGLSTILSGITFNDNFWENVFPYLLGSLCILLESCIIVVQFAIYRWIPAYKKKKKNIN